MRNRDTKSVETIVYKGFEVVSNGLYTVAMIANKFEMAECTVRKLIDNQTFTAKKVGKKYFICGNSIINRFFKDQKTKD